MNIVKCSESAPLNKVRYSESIPLNKIKLAKIVSVEIGRRLVLDGVFHGGGGVLKKNYQHDATLPESNSLLSFFAIFFFCEEKEETRKEVGAAI